MHPAPSLSQIDGVNFFRLTCLRGPGCSRGTAGSLLNYHIVLARGPIAFASYETCFLSSCHFQTCMIVDELLKNVEFDAARIIFNRFNSVVAFVPTVSTVLSPEVTVMKLAA